MSTRVNRGLAWLGFASTAVGLLDIVAMLLILNFWISKADLGIATMAVWIFPILDQATELGLSAALIQRDDHTETRTSTVFWVNLMLSLAAFLLLVAGAPPLAKHFYHQAIVGWMLIAYGSKLLLQNAYIIPTAMMKRELRFKELSIIKLLANIAEFFGKVGFAWAGFGIWCYVLGPLARTLVYAVGLQWCSPYRPRMSFNLADARDYVRFGLRTSGSQILFYFYTNIDYPIVGVFFGKEALGLYRYAYEIVLEPVRILSNVVVDIAFPAFARLRHSKEQLVAQFVSFTKLNLITVMSYAAVVFVAAPELIAVLFPDYAGAETAARILCGVAVLRAVGFVMPPLLDGVGRPERTFTYMTCAAVTMPILFVIGAAIGVRTHGGFESVAVAWAVGYPIAFSVLAYMATQTIGWSALKYLRAVIGVVACLVVAGAMAAALRYALAGYSSGIKLLATAGTVILASGFLLAYTQGLTLRSAMRSMREPPTDPSL
ncbi:MAG TPA: lipopolysaccharide biosynthesis protein [Kofleriaceae bacterium]|nr:lipopolysaccharide biosynthesis protein [Kofleriaceae bacterium]